MKYIFDPILKKFRAKDDYMSSAHTVIHESLTYNKLISLIAQNALVPGAFYRMTDFVTTAVDERETAQFRSAGHPFDLLLQALTTNKLSAKAAALPHADDTYFADVELDKWQVWYDINNDTTKYNWADAENGKGVIYRLIDEHNNDCPYDFKNIQFKRWAITDISSTSLTADALNSLKEALVYADNGNRHMANKDICGNWIPQDVQGTEYTIDENNFGWYYTFDSIFSEDGTNPGDHYDMSTHPFHLSDECIQTVMSDYAIDFADCCKNNIIKSAHHEYLVDDISYKGRQILNNIVFANNISYCFFNEVSDTWVYMTQTCYANVIETECKYNTFGNDCVSNSYGNNCCNNTLSDGCSFNIFEYNCTNNILGSYCTNNKFGISCSFNTFTGFCINNIFGDWCGANSFGSGSENNILGNHFDLNIAGNYFISNTIDQGCEHNTFGDSFQSNSLKADCSYNTFSNYITRSTFGNDFSSNVFENENIKYCSFGNGIKYCTISNTENSGILQNINVLNGTAGSHLQPLNISFQPNTNFTQFAALNSSGTLRIWNPADQNRNSMNASFNPSFE